MKKLAILGHPDTVLGFKALGLETIAVQEKESALKKLQALYDSNEYGVLFVTEDWMEKLQPELTEISQDAALPALVAVPGVQGSTGAGLKNIKQIVEKAVGSDILN